jgi:hypothetical protein
LKISYRTLINKIREAGLMQGAERHAPVHQDVSEKLDPKSVASAD